MAAMVSSTVSLSMGRLCRARLRLVCSLAGSNSTFSPVRLMINGIRISTLSMVLKRLSQAIQRRRRRMQLCSSLKRVSIT